MMAWRFESFHIRSRHISTYMSQQTIYPLQRRWCWDWNMGRDASKLGMVQWMILYCAQILYLKCIFGTKSRFGWSFPICLLTNGSCICTKSCVIQVLARKRKTNYGDSYHKELEETDRILLARRPKIWGRAIRSGRGISMKDRWMDAHRQVGSIPTYSTKTFFETI